MSRKKIIVVAVAVLMLAISFASSCNSAQSKIGAKGTTQMAGEWAVFNKPYSLGNKASKMNITLKRAEYTVGQIIIGKETYFPKDDEKLLVLYYTIHNPEKSLQSASWVTFNFTAVDSDDTNHNDINQVGQENNNKTLTMNLKPAQKIEAYTVIKVGANGEVPKLIVQRGSGLVLRYDLKGKVKPLATEYADPSDGSGATVLKDINASMGNYYHSKEFDFKYDSITSAFDTVGSEKVKKGKKLIVVGITIKNKSSKEDSISWNTLKPSLSTDSAPAKWLKNVYDDKSLEKISNLRLLPGQESSVKYIFEAKADSKVDTLSIKTNGNMVYNFKVEEIN